MPRVLPLIAVLVLPALASAEGMPRTAFQFDTRLGFQGGMVISQQGSTFGFNVTPQMTFGARLAGRVQVGVGLGLSHLGSGQSSTTFVLFSPLVAVDVLKARDDRVALYLKAGPHFGGIVQRTGPSTTNGTFALGFDLGLGARYAFHPMFALGMEAGAQTLFVDPTDPGETRFAGFYAALVGTFFAGK
jgi:hypothetical protein